MGTQRRWLAKIFCCLALCILSLASSWPLISNNLRYLYQEDDAHHFNRTLEMSARRELNPHYFNKPALHFYLRMPLVYATAWYEKSAKRISGLRDLRTRDPYGLAGYSFTPSHPKFLGVLRIESAAWSALICVATLIMVGLLRHSIRIAFASGLLVLASPEVLKNSHLIGVDTLMALICSATSAFAFWSQSAYSRRKLAICGLLAGLACASKYNAAPIVCVPLALWWLYDRSIKGLFLVATLPALGFLFAAPYTVLEWGEFIKGISYEAWHYRVAGHEGHTAEPGWPQALLYLRWAFSDGIGVSAAVLAILGGCWLSVYDRRGFLLLSAFPIPYCTLMICQRTHFTRNMVVMVPYLATLAGVGIVALVSTIKRRRYQHIAAVIITTIAIWPIANRSVSIIHAAQSQTDSRDLALEWIKNRVNSAQSGALDHTSSEGDIAVAGPLQLPIATFELKGVDAFNPAKQGLTQLIQSGYEYIVLPSDLSLLDAELTDLVLSIPGEPWPSRIPRNPAISIVKVKQSAVEKAASSAPSALSLLAGRTYFWPICPEARTEKRCWITKRVTELTVHSPSGTGVIEILTPWANQIVTVTDPSGMLLASTKLAARDTWEALPIPEGAQRTRGLEPRKVIISITQVHSPQAHRVNSDTRRLGVAIRAGG